MITDKPRLVNFFFGGWPERWRYTWSLLLAIASGFLAYYIGLPLPWMLGPLIGCGFFAAIGKGVIIGKKPRPVCRALLGCTTVSYTHLTLPTICSV